MPFIPHTKTDIEQMLASIGAKQIETLFDEIPKDLLSTGFSHIPEGMSEMEISRLMLERAETDGRYLNFIGAGAYEHHIPAAVWQIVTRGEFYSAYTPYQAEASQGTLQLLYEFQTMMASLTGLEVSNASLYDGASALAEAVLMAVRSHKNSKRILMPDTVHPFYREAVHSIVKNQGIQIISVPYCRDCGYITPETLSAFGEQDYAALVIPQPNFFGVLEHVDELTNWAHSKGSLVIGIVNPISLALLKPPGQWGTGKPVSLTPYPSPQGRGEIDKGADIAVGEAQPLGIPLSSGGPYLGFMCCKSALVRQMPGRIIGRTVDLDGRQGFTLTLQAREQHIRRSKATSNICTNQGLMVTAATIYLALTGPAGLKKIAAQSHYNTARLAEELCKLSGIKKIFSGESFHEIVLELPLPIEKFLHALKQEKILGGLNLSTLYPELPNTLLLCATETKTEDDLQRYIAAAKKITQSSILNPRS